MTASDTKFESEIIPLVLVALHNARQSKRYSEITVKLSADGGCVGIVTVSQEKIK